MPKIEQTKIDKVWLAALENGWAFFELQLDIYMISFKKGYTRLNYYLTTETVATALNHPRRGKPQLYRKNINLQKLKSIFKNPRTHTGVGYYRK